MKKIDYIFISIICGGCGGSFFASLISKTQLSLIIGAFIGTLIMLYSYRKYLKN